MNENARPVIMNRSSASGHFACRIEAPLIPRNGDIMRIHVGCELSFDFPQTVPMIATLNVHFSRFSDLERPDHLVTKPSVPVEGYRDSFGNWCSRLLLLAGTLLLPFPFSHIIPALVIMLVSFAYLEEDGALLCISLAAALASFSITAATVWGTVRAMGLLEKLL